MAPLSKSGIRKRIVGSNPTLSANYNAQTLVRIIDQSQQEK